MFYNTLSRVAPALFMLSIAAFAASDNQIATKAGDESTAITQSKIDKWFAGTVTRVDAEKNEISLKGSELPFATAHAQMRSEAMKETKNASADEKPGILQRIKNAWKDRLQKARNEKRADAAELTFKTPSDGSLAVLQKREIQKVAIFSRTQLVSEKGKDAQPVAEVDLVSIYEAPENEAMDNEPKAINTSVGKSGEDSGKLSLNDIKPGDRVLIGVDSSSNTAQAVILAPESPKSDSMKEEKSAR